MNDKVQLAKQYIKMAINEHELSQLASAQALAAISTAISTAHIAEAEADACGAGRRPVTREINYRPIRILMIIVFAVLHIVLVLIGVLAVLDIWVLLPKQFAGLLGLMALGGIAAFFTACRSAMDRVCYESPLWKRGLKCVYRASQLEALFHMPVGFSVGGGSYLVAMLAKSM